MTNDFITCLAGSQDLGSRRSRRVIRHAIVVLNLFLLSFLLLGFLFPLVGEIAGVPQGSQRHNCHKNYPDRGATDEDPSETFDLGSGIAIELDADFVVYLLDLKVLLENGGMLVSG